MGRSALTRAGLQQVPGQRRAAPDRRDRMRRINTIHFVGIGGSGMGGADGSDLSPRVSDVRAADVPAEVRWISLGHGSGTGEVRNWIAAAAVVDGAPGTVVDYVEINASPVGAAFAYWDLNR